MVKEYIFYFNDHDFSPSLSMFLSSYFLRKEQGDKQTVPSSKAGPWRKVCSCYLNFVCSWSTRIAVTVPFNITYVDWAIVQGS